ncbi:MAG: hypothetical protein GX409_03725, partial [candidate division Zixibacteria bacterium]|nr:hypothetical protein [candidate division Zixibacteria bacterium]
ECRWLDEHISECSQCLTEYEAIQKLNHLAGKIDLAPPESQYWKNFSARTMARIATSEARTFKSRGRLFFTGYRTRIIIFGMAAMVVLAVGLSYYFGGGQNISIVSAVKNQSNSEIEAITPNVPANKAIDNSSITGSEITISKKTFADSSAGNSDTRIFSNLSEFETSDLVSAESNQTLRGRFRYNATIRTSLVEPDVPAGTGTMQSDWLEPHTDMVIVYQINQGSKAGERPLMLYHQANVRFFGPDKSMRWRDISRLKSPNWGFATGDKQADASIGNHFNLELDLSQDK